MNQNKTILIALLLLLLMAVMPAMAGDPVAGQQKSAACQACHGLDGHSVDPTYPNLAGQHQSYLAKSLSDYRDGNRTNAIMAGMASNLTDEDIADLAAWYSSQEGLKDISIK
jgi:cytochrome c553